MHFRLIFLLLLLLLASVTCVSAADYRSYTQIQSISYSQPIAIQSMVREWQPPFKGGSKAFTYNRAEVGMRWGNWQFGILERYDYLLEFSPQTAELFNLTESRLPLEAGREYELRIKARQQRSRGVRLGYRQKFSSKFSVEVAASYLQGKSLTDGSIRGSAQVTANNDYEFQFETDYFYSRDVLFERDVAPPKGSGYSTDILFDWRPGERFQAQLSIVDLLGKIFWENAPYTVATASSATKIYDENGYVRYAPAISGRESNRNFTQVLPRKIFFMAKYQWSPDVELLAEIQDFGIVRFISAGAGWCYRRSDCFQGLFNQTAGALSLRYLGHGLRVELASDQLNINRARYLVFQFSFNRNF
ncbi:MAG: hypothetical protein GXP17_02335 [Gammaproteobacteria bacterium]|nr:hypothetical protein [Gammaproteobacteria bacterium]